MAMCRLKWEFGEPSRERNINRVLCFGERLVMRPGSRVCRTTPPGFLITAKTELPGGELFLPPSWVSRLHHIDFMCGVRKILKRERDHDVCEVLFTIRIVVISAGGEPCHSEHLLVPQLLELDRDENGGVRSHG